MAPLQKNLLQKALDSAKLTVKICNKADDTKTKKSVPLTIWKILVPIRKRISWLFKSHPTFAPSTFQRGVIAVFPLTVFLDTVFRFWYSVKNCYSSQHTGLEIKCHSVSVSRYRHIIPVTSSQPVTRRGGGTRGYVVLCFVYDSSDIVWWAVLTIVKLLHCKIPKRRLLMIAKTGSITNYYEVFCMILGFIKEMHWALSVSDKNNDKWLCCLFLVYNLTRSIKSSHKK